jgi:class 3 adenylate cyclase
MKHEEKKSRRTAHNGAHGLMKRDREELTAEKDLPFGERRVATVLFSDLAGYSNLAEQLDPEDLAGIMNRIRKGALTSSKRTGGL